MALLDYDYKFIYIDPGCQGRISDGGIFSNSSFFEKMVNNSHNLPTLRPLPKPNVECWKPLENDGIVPFDFVAENGFPLTTGIMKMKPYPDKGLAEKMHWI